MPNWCQNRVSFYSDNEQDISKLKSIFESDEPFNTIVPAPDWKTTPNDQGELPVLREMKSPKTGEVFYKTYDFPDGTNDDRWYSWNLANWGTKWELAEVECEHHDSNSLECEFETAWSPPEEIFYALRQMFEDVSISLLLDEPKIQVAGYLNNQ